MIEKTSNSFVSLLTLVKCRRQNLNFKNVCIYSTHYCINERRKIAAEYSVLRLRNTDYVDGEAEVVKVQNTDERKP